jgi:hypothetical protein
MTNDAKKTQAKGPKRGPNCQHPSCGLSQCRDGGFSGEPSGTRTRDPLIKRRRPVMNRPSVFLRSSAQPRAAARVLIARLARLGDCAGFSAHSRTEIGVLDECVQRKSAQAFWPRRPPYCRSGAWGKNEGSHAAASCLPRRPSRATAWVPIRCRSRSSANGPCPRLAKRLRR